MAVKDDRGVGTGSFGYIRDRNIEMQRRTCTIAYPPALGVPEPPTASAPLKRDLSLSSHIKGFSGSDSRVFIA